jgi:hypothetical protein
MWRRAPRSRLAPWRVDAEKGFSPSDLLSQAGAGLASGGSGRRRDD